MPRLDNKNCPMDQQRHLPHAVLNMSGQNTEFFFQRQIGLVPIQCRKIVRISHEI